MAAPLGNKNASKSKPWSDAIRRAIARYDAKRDEDAKFLNVLADQLLIDCINREKSALEELTNRLDGKAAQSVTVGGDEDNPIHTVNKIILTGDE